MTTALHAGMVTLESLFLIGCVGSLIVVVISGIEDMATILTKDKGGPTTAVGGDHDLR